MALSPPSISITLAQVHELVGGELHGDGGKRLSALASLTEANPEALSFVANERALEGQRELRAGALLVRRHLQEVAIPQIVVGHPLLAFAQVAERFFVQSAPPRGIADNLTKGAGVQIGADPSIWPFVSLGDRVIIGSRVTLYPGVFVGSESIIGDDTVLYPNVVVREGCSIGSRVIVHSGTVIGADGFGYFRHQGRQHKIPQLGGVTIEDDVELGANVTIDRATFGQTVIKQGTKIDNLVQIAHNVSIGEHSVVTAQVGIAGSTTVGHHAVIGGQAGLTDHIEVGEHVTIGAQAGVHRNLESNQVYFGSPVMPHALAVTVQSAILLLPELRQLVRELKQRVATLEEQLARPSASVGKGKRSSRSSTK